MVDYAKLVEEERARQGSALAAAEAQERREIDLIGFFRGVEIELGREMVKANQELKKRGSPVIVGPFRPVKDAERIELTFGSRRPCCRVALLRIDMSAGLASIQAELLDDREKTIAQTQFIIEGEGSALRAYRPLVEGVPDRAAEVTASEIAQEIVPGIIRGHFG